MEEIIRILGFVVIGWIIGYLVGFLYGYLNKRIKEQNEKNVQNMQINIDKNLIRYLNH